MIYKQSQMRSFKIGEHVLAQNIRRIPKWLPGVVVGKAGNVSYQVKVGHQVWSRHIDQLLRHEADLQTPSNESPIDSTTFPGGDSVGPQEASYNNDPETDHDLNTDTSVILPEEPQDSQSANATGVPDTHRGKGDHQIGSPQVLIRMGECSVSIDCNCHAHT